MIDNEHDADPVMVGGTTVGSWPVGDVDPVARVDALAALFADEQGTRSAPCVRLALDPDQLDHDGTIVLTADDAASLAAVLDHAAETARRGVLL